jgi:hypothetical protein
MILDGHEVASVNNAPRWLAVPLRSLRVLLRDQRELKGRPGLSAGPFMSTRPNLSKSAHGKFCAISTTRPPLRS